MSSRRDRSVLTQRHLGIPDGEVCVICKKPFYWPTSYLPSQDLAGGYYHMGCDEQQERWRRDDDYLRERRLQEEPE